MGVDAAGKRAETIIAEKRERSSELLDTWSEGVRRSERLARKKEVQQIKDAEESWSQYTERLSQIGTRRAEKSHHNGQEELKIQLQHDLKAELYATQRNESRELAAAVDAKQQAAAARREKGASAKYSFVEKAFGPQAPGFDAKFHWATTDRRSPSWRKNAEAWESNRGRFSEPVLTIAR